MHVPPTHEVPVDAKRSVLVGVAIDATRRARLYELLGAFCHESRNHLNTLKLSLYLAGRSAARGDAACLSDLETRYRSVEDHFDRLQQICRPMRLTPVRLPLALLWDEVFPVWAEQFGRRGATFAAVAPRVPVACDFDPTRLRPALDAFADWRARVATAGRSVTLSWKADDAHSVVEWVESAITDGPAANSGPDEARDSFALPFLARVLAAHGGGLDVESGPRPGFRALLRWPVEIRVHE